MGRAARPRGRSGLTDLIRQFMDRAGGIISNLRYTDDDDGATDAFDLIMPPDFFTSDQFELVDARVLDGDRWRPDPEPR